MSYPIARIDPSTPGRERSPALWRNALEKYSADRSLGVLRSDDFTSGVSCAGGAGTLATDGRWFMSEEGTTGATSEDFATSVEPDGVAVLQGTTGADFIGVQVHAGPTATLVENIVTPKATTDAKSDVYCEARVYLNTAENDTLFVGLAEAGSTVLTGTNLLTQAADYIGFYRLDGGDLQFVSHNDQDGTQTAIVVKTAAQVAAGYEDAFVKLGFRISNTNKVTVYVDGVEIKKDSSDALVTVPELSIPVEKLARKLAACRGATLTNATVQVQCDWFDCYVAE